MKCPHCLNVELLITHRKGIEIDFCPKCRGAWLEHGELDRIILRTFPHKHVVEEKHHSVPHDAHYDMHLAKKEKSNTFLENLFGSKD